MDLTGLYKLTRKWTVYQTKEAELVGSTCGEYYKQADCTASDAQTLNVDNSLLPVNWQFMKDYSKGSRSDG